MIASISTVIPCYRCSNTIRRAVDSVAKQTLRPAEVILVDDGSKDETLKVLIQIQRDYGEEWIKVIALEANRGVSVARNTAWDVASHDYIAFLDADDAWHPEKIAVQYSWMLRHPDIALCGHHVVFTNPEVQLNHEPVPGKIKATWVSKNKLLFFNVFCTSSVVVKRTLNQRFCPSLRYCQDYFLWLEILLAGRKTAVLNFPVSYSFKAPFGEGGLTKNLVDVEADISEIYRRLLKSGHITFGEWCILSVWSSAKYYRRVCICLLRSVQIEKSFGHSAC